MDGVSSNAVFSTIRCNMRTVAAPGYADGGGGRRKGELCERSAEETRVEEKKGRSAGDSENARMKEERRVNGLEGD